ncbi:DUF2796 domain-containing protein [Catenovulum adriaticum]|uniref:DUF2796 domain-containing protein n=1 Tax=Catenovulum adriaticum TaxID=2984846 RepID=A0ABY7AKL2_9ALTE|nr:DUF2796 domain-containing protein [Catenovulum sp. TS8]WAJ69711.1 DUF2796 domain-containing protein [Catenovulum sp. TS8]
MRQLLNAKNLFIAIKLILKISFIATLLAPTHATASTDAAHVHGLAELMLVLEEDHLAIQFSSPTINLVGFEHKATNAKDIAKIENLSKVLNQPEKLFAFAGARCTPIDNHVDVSSLIDTQDKAHGHDKRHHNDSHSEVIVEYRFKCENLTHLSSIQLGLFKTFSGIEQIQAMWVTQTKQGASQLNADNSTLMFR